MSGAIAMVCLLVVVFPMVITGTGAIVAGMLGHFVKSGVDAANVDADGNPNEYLAISNTDHYRS